MANRKHTETPKGESRYKTEQEKRADEMQAQQIRDTLYPDPAEVGRWIDWIEWETEDDPGGFLTAGWYDATFDEVDRYAHLGWLAGEGG